MSLIPCELKHIGDGYGVLRFYSSSSLSLSFRSYSNFSTFNSVPPPALSPRPLPPSSTPIRNVTISNIIGYKWQYINFIHDFVHFYFMVWLSQFRQSLKVAARKAACRVAWVRASFISSSLITHHIQSFSKVFEKVNTSAISFRYIYI